MKLKAFTIVELMVGMLITAILVGAVWSAYVFFSNSWVAIKKTGGNDRTLMDLQYALKHDIYYAQAIYANENTLSFKNVNQKDIEYLFLNDRCIVRTTHSGVDTFRLSPTQFYFSKLNTSLLIDSIRFIVKADSTQVSMFFQKMYDANTLMDSLNIIPLQ